MLVAANAAGVALKTTAVTAARDTACARAIKSSTRAIASSHATRARASDDARARGTTIDRECDSDPRPARMCARVDVERASVDAIARLRSGAIRSVEIHSIVRARPGRRKRVGRVDACAIESHHHHRSRSYQPSIARSRVRTLFAEALTTVFALTDFEVVIFWAMALPVKADVDAATDMVERSCAMRSAGRAGRARDRIEVAADSRSLGGGVGASQDSTCRVFDTNVTTLGATRTIIRAYRPDLDLDLDLDLDPRTRA
jgi:hypothetical protein